MSKAIRLSPSGPSIANAGGAPFAPGPGARLRLNEATSTGTQALSASVAPLVGSGYVIALDAPNPALNYRATALIDAENDSTNVTAAIQLYLDISPDNATWTEVASNGHLVGPLSVRQIRVDSPLKLGSALGVLTTWTNIFLRARIGASVGAAASTSSGSVPGADPTNKGTALLQLEECF